MQKGINDCSQRNFVIQEIVNVFSGPILYGLHRADAMGAGMPEITLIQCLVFSAVIVAVDPVAVSWTTEIYTQYCSKCKYKDLYTKFN